jgi:hypothetical protein
VPESQPPGTLHIVGRFDTGPLAGLLETRRSMEVVESSK